MLSTNLLVSNHSSDVYHRKVSFLANFWHKVKRKHFCYLKNFVYFSCACAIMQRRWERCRGRLTAVSTSSSVSTRYWRSCVRPTSWSCSTVPATDATTRWWPPSATSRSPGTATSTSTSHWTAPAPARPAARWPSTRPSSETRADTRSSSELSIDVSQVNDDDSKGRNGKGSGFIYRLYWSTLHSRRSDTDHTVLPANYTVPASTS